MINEKSFNLPEETHPFKPFVPDNGRLLMCGTFPPKANRWSMEFYYPNFINDMWRIMGLIFFDDSMTFVDASKKTFFLDKIKEFLCRTGIALSDTGAKAVRLKDNASDKWLEITEPLDLKSLLDEMPACHDVCTTGQKAAEAMAVITSSVAPALGEYAEFEFLTKQGVRKMRHWRMPSSSRAYPMKLAVKAQYYKRMFETVGVYPLTE